MVDVAYDPLHRLLHTFQAMHEYMWYWSYVT